MLKAEAEGRGGVGMTGPGGSPYPGPAAVLSLHQLCASGVLSVLSPVLGIKTPEDGGRSDKDLSWLTKLPHHSL